MSEPDICANNHGNNRESLEAHEVVAPVAHQLRWKIVDTIKEQGPLTCDEVEERTGMKHQTCSARFSELKRDGILVPTGERRLTRSGRTKAAVFELRRQQ